MTAGVQFITLATSGATLKQIRNVYDYTQQNVASILGCTQSNVSKLDNRQISIVHLELIAKAAGHQAFVMITAPRLQN